jgi:hypothetical protein
MKGADSIQMKFPFPGVTALKGRVAQDNIRIAGSNRAAVYRDTLGAIQTAYWELMFTHEATTITRETLALLNRLEAVAATRYKSGNTSYQDVAKVQIRRQELAEELVSWKRRRQSQEAQIRALLDLVSDTAIARPKPVSPGRTLPSRPQLIRLALEKRQELVRLRAQLDKMDHMILMAETMIRPTYGPNLSAYENRPVQTVGGGAVKAPFALTTTAQKGAGLPKMPWYGSQDAYLRDHDKAKYFPRSMPRHPARHRVAPPRFCPG